MTVENRDEVIGMIKALHKGDVAGHVQKLQKLSNAVTDGKVESMTLHDRQAPVELIKAALAQPGERLGFKKGDVPGHPFHGNQYGSGEGGAAGGKASDSSPKTLAFVADQLSNDESSTDEELHAHFVSEGLSPEAASHYVAQRDKFLSTPIPTVGMLVPFTGASKK